ncbi:MAG TPA: 4-(cytidine 5'-diphospho)-2-C-methyl-D-erythritol kinase [Thermoanaerobaculaceae bacterium]|nr:4-(cytidine 5'-diphospho)-2-C-methyl-D-erythritol kinase [Thermoanaerobaculaceae bacterium]
MTIRVRCPAKVNLHLEVVGRRPDGYHELRTLFAAVGVWDELELEPAPAGVLELAVEPTGAAPPGEDNLVVRAARALAVRFDVRAGTRIRLVKSIPAGGGLGGGSADAAAALVGLVSLWGLDCGSDVLQPIAAGLGADVPFFLVGGIAFGTGRGCDLRPLPDAPPWWVVLLPGPEPISTAAVYAAFRRRPLAAPRVSAVYEWVERGGAPPLAACRNDLEPTVVSLWPEVGQRLERIAATSPRLALLAGSGGTVFGVFPDEAGARRAAERLADAGPRVAPVLGREASLPRPLVGEESKHGDQ